MYAMMLISLMIMIVRHHTKISSPTWSMTVETCQLLSHDQEHKSSSMTLLSQSVVSICNRFSSTKEEVIDTSIGLSPQNQSLLAMILTHM